MIEIPGYTLEEKVEIAVGHLLPKQLEVQCMQEGDTIATLIGEEEGGIRGKILPH